MKLQEKSNKYSEQIFEFLLDKRLFDCYNELTNRTDVQIEEGPGCTRRDPLIINNTIAAAQQAGAVSAEEQMPQASAARLPTDEAMPDAVS